MSSRPNASPQKRCLSELLGTYLLVLIGPGTVAAVSIAQDISPLEALLIIGFAFGATVALVILLLGRISGAHINPAVTLAHTVAGKTTLEMFLPYVSSQVLGGLLGAFTVKLIFSQFASPADLGTTKLASGVSVPGWNVVGGCRDFRASNVWIPSLITNSQETGRSCAYWVDSIRHHSCPWSVDQCFAQSRSKSGSGSSVRLLD